MADKNPQSLVHAWGGIPAPYKRASPAVGPLSVAVRGETQQQQATRSKGQGRQVMRTCTRSAGLQKRQERRLTFCPLSDSVANGFISCRVSHKAVGGETRHRAPGEDSAARGQPRPAPRGLSVSRVAPAPRVLCRARRFWAVSGPGPLSSHLRPQGERSAGTETTTRGPRTGPGESAAGVTRETGVGRAAGGASRDECPEPCDT